MGEKASRFFSDAERLGGIPTKARLASLARITSAEALAVPDDAALIARLTSAFSRLRRELDGTSASGVYVPPTLPPETTAQGVAERLRRHVTTFVDLMSQRALLLGDTQETVRRVDEAATAALPVARVSVWMTDPDFSKIVCADLYDSIKGVHLSGMELFATDFRPYFEALKSERTIMANEARIDPRTSCFARPYLEPNGIGAMLDVPIWSRGRMVGVVCHEHVGGSRKWDADEERFAYLMSGFVAMSLERAASSTTGHPGKH